MSADGWKVEQRLEARREAGPRHPGARRHQDAGDERASVGRVVTDRERLPLPAEDDLLVGDEARQTNRMHADPIEIPASDAVEALRHRAAPRLRALVVQAG